MNTFINSESDEECCVLQVKVPEFTEEDQTEAINVLFTMAKILATRNNDLAQEYCTFAQELNSVKPDAALSLLTAYLQPEKINTVNNIKSFIFLKRISDKVSEETKIIEKKLSKKVVFSMLHILFYKTLPCMKGNQCKHTPRRIVHKNDFQDYELDCYFYHHEKDRRRHVLNNGDKEFKYAGNFGDGKKEGGKSLYSLNFFESLYHPLYYKNFRCVRSQCTDSVFCPYNHSLEEKNIFFATFKNFFGKDREIFTKKRNSEEEKHGRFFAKRHSGRSTGTGAKRLSGLSTGSMK